MQNPRHLNLVKVIFLSAIVLCSTERAIAQDSAGIVIKSIPEKLVVLTFDDACQSHATFVAPLLKKLGFNATFYITEFEKTFTQKNLYMTWEQIKNVDDMGFEIGNHSLRHLYFPNLSVKECGQQLAGLEERCLANKVTRPNTFCWPMYAVNKNFFPVLAEKGYLFARGGGERPYNPTEDNPLDVPSYTIHDKSLQRRDSFADSAKLATGGKIVIFTFHGVPDLEHPSVGVDPARFKELMQYLKENHYTVISMRDLGKYIDATKAAKIRYSRGANE
ncbi:MAG: hypothetical protein A2X86_13055 [Bdellovibrionales bacterium GWA2_49_15]|nr:MAG: hypothetical protein A2X86_13055 [Bdellovibrionales bacterium GWA2_49_15]HAZ13451.1 polysaccharide deacetylase [Bdellovibrionales bacterium]